MLRAFPNNRAMRTLLVAAPVLLLGACASPQAIERAQATADQAMAAANQANATANQALTVAQQAAADARAAREAAERMYNRSLRK